MVSAVSYTDMRNSRWVRLLAYVTGSVNQELLVPILS
jgi:hypothetical protein